MIRDMPEWQLLEIRAVAMGKLSPTYLQTKAIWELRQGKRNATDIVNDFNNAYDDLKEDLENATTEDN